MNNRNIHLSSYGELSAAPSPVSAMMAAFAHDFREDCDINLGVGYVNERTIPDRRFCEAADYVLSHPVQYRCALNYGGPAGSPNLIASLRRFHVEHGIGRLAGDIVDRSAVVIGANGATSLLTALSDTIAPGIVVTSDPMYYIYCNTLERKGFEILTVPEDAEGISADGVRDALKQLGSRRSAIAFIYVVTVNNPTCTILSNARRRELVEIASQLSRDIDRPVPLILDKAYEFLVHDPAIPPPESGLLHDDLGVVYELGTLSKILAPGLRIGYMMGPPGPLVDAVVQWTSDVGFSAPLINQEIASYLIDRHIVEQRDRVNRGYREKALQTRDWIGARLGPFLEECRGGQAGFYFYLTLRDIETCESSAFFRYLARATGDEAVDGPARAKNARVVYIPGEYCVHARGQMAQAGRRQLRLSYGYEELPRIGEGLAHMQQAALWSADLRRGAAASR